MATCTLKPQGCFKRSSYTVDFKIQVINWLRKNGANVSAAARESSVWTENEFESGIIGAMRSS